MKSKANDSCHCSFFILLRRLIEVILAVANIIIMYVTDFSDDADDTSVIGYRYKCCILRSFESIVVCYVCATATTYVVLFFIYKTSMTKNLGPTTYIFTYIHMLVQVTYVLK